MKRLLVLGLLLGCANAIAAFAVMFAVYRVSPPDEVFGFFGAVPPGVVYDDYYSDFPREYLGVPLVLVVLNMALLPLLVRSTQPRG
jgi:hypothetical protein